MTEEDRRPEVVLLCGVAGSGKTTYSQDLETQGYVRLSVDEAIWERSGRFGVDYDASAYEAHSAVASRSLDERLTSLVAQGRDVVVDSSLWRRERREECKRLVEHAGGRWRLVYLKVDEAVLRERLAERAGRFDANAAFPITDELLTHFLTSFEAPSGEGEEIVVVPGE
jgi:predicted kinase